VIGRALIVNDVAFTIIGILPRGFTGAGLSACRLLDPGQRVAEADARLDDDVARTMAHARRASRSREYVGTGGAARDDRIS
jgi:hypothetical protein